MYQNDERIVLTLDAGGTNFVFSAIQGNKEVVDSIRLPSNADDLDKCLATIVNGFEQLESKISSAPVALSFAFPGPADYPNGVVGDLENLPSFRGGIALGPMLQKKFNLPVYLNNDGDLFAYGEAIAGFLPWVNAQLEKAGSPKRYKNLLGLTFGTGFGAGIVSNDELFLGDNSASAEIWSMRNGLRTDSFAEEGVSIRAVQKAYAKRTGAQDWQALTPKDIYDIAEGAQEGDVQAAKQAFAELGKVSGDAIANATILVDGIVVIGGGLAAAHKYFLDALVQEMNSELRGYDGGTIQRMESTAFNLHDEQALHTFLKGEARMVTIPGTDEQVPYDPQKRIGVGISTLGASEAISIGAYAFALHELDKA